MEELEAQVDPRKRGEGRSPELVKPVGQRFGDGGDQLPLVRPQSGVDLAVAEDAC